MQIRLLSIRAYLALHRVWRKTQRLVLFWKPGRGAELFLERYRPDHVLAVSEDERSYSTATERCQVCSLCTMTCQAIQSGDAPALFEPKQMVAFFAKYENASEIFLEEWYPCSKCGACTVLCPNQVPVHTMVEQLMQRRARLGFRRGTQRTLEKSYS